MEVDARHTPRGHKGWDTDFILAGKRGFLVFLTTKQLFFKRMDNLRFSTPLGTPFSLVQRWLVADCTSLRTGLFLNAGATSTGGRGRAKRAMFLEKTVFTAAVP